MGSTSTIVAILIVFVCPAMWTACRSGAGEFP